MTTSVDPYDVVHKAAPDMRLTQRADGGSRCLVCGQRIHKVPGGSGPTWVHTASGAVAEANPPGYKP